MANVHDHVPYPLQTVSGKTVGPAVALGRSRVGRGQLLFLHEIELRQALADMGWPRPEQHDKAVTERDQAVEKVARLEAEVADLTRKLEVAIEALKLVQTSVVPTTPPPAPAPPAKTRTVKEKP